MLPQNHPRRTELNDEVHARPPESLLVPRIEAEGPPLPLVQFGVLRRSDIVLDRGDEVGDGGERRVDDVRLVLRQIG